MLLTTLKLPLLPLTLFAILATAPAANAYYDPGVQRWINRDPIQEQGGLNLYAFTGNGPVQRTDRDGRSWRLIPVRDCNLKEWTTANARCKAAYGWWSVVSWCKAIKIISVGGTCFRANLWTIIHTCTMTAPDPVDPGTGAAFMPDHGVGAPATHSEGTDH
jgi:hypothetical protein